MRLTPLRAALVALLPVAFAAMFVGVTADRAEAACHSFEVAVSPSKVKEGGKVTVTVSRDANVNPSSIHVSTIDETAKAPADYMKLDETVSFSSETSKDLSIQTVNDTADEPDETFRVHLSDPGGCAVNTSYVIGPDAKVTILDDDAPPSGGGGGGPGPSAAPAPQPVLESLSPGVTPTPDVTASATPDETAEATTSSLAAPEESDDDGAPVGLIVGALIAAAAAATGAGVLWARSRGSGAA